MVISKVKPQFLIPVTLGFEVQPKWWFIKGRFRIGKIAQNMALDEKRDVSFFPLLRFTYECIFPANTEDTEGRGKERGLSSLVLKSYERKGNGHLPRHHSFMAKLQSTNQIATLQL